MSPAVDMAAFSVGPMTRQDLDWAVDLAAAEGWNPGLRDAEAFWAADPAGFFIGRYQGRRAAAVSAVDYGGGFAFAGFYIVRPEYRGLGFGRRLGELVLSRLAGTIIGLDGVVEQQPTYRKLGFEFEFNSFRMSGPAGPHSDEGLVDLKERPFELALDFDSTCFPVPRPAFLKTWLNLPGHRALGRVENDRLTGYGVIRPCREGHKIGPLFATDPATADRLFQGLRGAVDAGPVFLDIPQNNPAAVELGRRHGLEQVFETARMYLGGRPAWATERVYGLTSFELG